MTTNEIEDGMSCAGLVPSATDKHIEQLDKHIERLRKDNAMMAAAIQLIHMEHKTNASPLARALAGTHEQRKITMNAQTGITPHAPKRYTRTELVAHWRALCKEHRISEVSNRRHRNEDLAKWHEGKADAFDRCADMLEHLFAANPDQ